MLVIVLFLRLRTRNFTISWSLQPRWPRSVQLLHPDLHISTCPFLFLSMRSNRSPLSIKSLSSCVRKPSKHSENSWIVMWRRHHLLLHPDQQTPKTMSYTNPNLHSAGPSSIPKKNFTNPCYSLIQRATPHPCFPGLSLKSLCLFTAALQPCETAPTSLQTQGDLCIQ